MCIRKSKSAKQTHSLPLNCYIVIFMILYIYIYITFQSLPFFVPWKLVHYRIYHLVCKLAVSSKTISRFPSAIDVTKAWMDRQACKEAEACRFFSFCASFTNSLLIHETAKALIIFAGRTLFLPTSRLIPTTTPSPPLFPYHNSNLQRNCEKLKRVTIWCHKIVTNRLCFLPWSKLCTTIQCHDHPMTSHQLCNLVNKIHIKQI